MSQALIVLIITVVMIIAFFSNVIPIAASELFVPMFLQMTGVLSFKEAFEGFSSSTTVSLFTLFILGGILGQTSFLERLRVFVSTKIASSKNGKKHVLLASMLMSMVLSTFTNPSSAMAIMLPIVIAVAKDVNLPVKNTIKACTDVANTSNNVLPVGGALTAYLTFNGFLEAAGATQRFRMMDPFIAKVPTFLIYFAFIYFVGYKLYCKEGNTEINESALESKGSKDEKKKRQLTPFQDKLGMFLFFGGAVFIIVGSAVFDIDVYMIAGCCILVGLLTKVITYKEALKAVHWDTLFVYGGTVCLGQAMTNAGINDLIADWSSSVLGSVSNPILVTALIFVVTFVITQFCNNRTVGAVFRPLSVAIGMALGVDPRLTLLAAHYGSSLSTLTPMASATQLYAFTVGNFKMKEYFLGALIPSMVFLVSFLIWFPLCIHLGLV